MKINRILRELLGIILLLFKYLIPEINRNIISIYFHNPNVELFESIVKYLIKNNYSIISLKDLTEIIDHKMLDKRIAIITFDDGWLENIKLIKIIRKYEVNITLFITTSAIETGNFWFEFIDAKKESKGFSPRKKKLQLKRMSLERFNCEIREIKKGMKLSRSALSKQDLIKLSNEPFVTIGSHSVTHGSLSQMSRRLQLIELLNSKKKLEEWTGKEIDFFAFPNGDYTEQTKELAKECGYELCFTINPSPVNLNNLDAFTINRRCINDNAGYYEALSKLYGLWYKIRKV